MGIYDRVLASFICPVCGNCIDIDEQIKWTRHPNLNSYFIGDKIDADDDIYMIATNTRLLEETCCNCNTKIKYEAVVEDGILKSIRPHKHKYAIIGTLCDPVDDIEVDLACKYCDKVKTVRVDNKAMELVFDLAAEHKEFKIPKKYFHGYVRDEENK